MPIYEYRCQDCQQIFEEWQKHFEDVQANCPVCGGYAKRLISNTSFILKGSGWYVTDYARGKSNSASNVNGNGGEKKESTGEQKTETSTSETSSSSEKKSSSTSNTSTSTSA